MADEKPATSPNPWLSIWWKPQATIKALLQPGRRTHTLLLAAIVGIGLMIDMAHPVLHWFTVMVAAVLLGPAFGILGLYIYGTLLAWTGRPLGGQGSQRALRAGLAWGAMPNVMASLILLGAVVLLRQDFLRPYASMTYTGNLLFDAIMVTTEAFAVWSIVLSIRAIGAVQDFGLWRSIVNFVASVAVVFAVWIPFRMFLYQPFVEVSRAMEPTLEHGDFFFVEKWRYGWSRYGFDMRLGSASPARGDLIVYRHPDDAGPEFAKRIVGLPGDEIRVEGGQVVINGTPVPRRPLGDVVLPDGLGSDEVLTAFEERLPEGPTITVLNGKTEGFLDNAGPVRVTPGHYFVIGDNRDRSLDSRFPDHGLVPARNIVGRVGAIYLSAQTPSDTDTISGVSGNIRWHRMFRVPR